MEGPLHIAWIDEKKGEGLLKVQIWANVAITSFYILSILYQST